MWDHWYPAGLWAVDFEFTALPGERSLPVCMVARELNGGRIIRLWEDEFDRDLPFPVGSDALFIAFVTTAEFSCFRSLNWPMPERILDLSVEFRDRTSGIARPHGASLLGALAYFGLDVTGSTEKPAMQQALGDGTWRGKYSRQEVLDYCTGDVDALERLLLAMASRIDLPHALLRGRYMAALSAVEFNGIPIDVSQLTLLRKHWPAIKTELILKIDADYGCFEDGHFRIKRWAEWLAKHKIPWPLTDTGLPATDDDTFRERAKCYPEVSPMRELRHALSELRLEDLAVGADGRNRTPLWAFGSKTGRNQPSNTKYIFGPSVWLRRLRWSRLSEQFLRIDKWSVCRG